MRLGLGLGLRMIVYICFVEGREMCFVVFLKAIGVGLDWRLVKIVVSHDRDEYSLL